MRVDTSVAGADAPSEPVGALGQRAASRPYPAIVAIGLAAAAVGVVFRFVTTSRLWLDEALSVNIADVGLANLAEALRQDGAPPLYYVLLHVWMTVFGDSDVAVRALSGVFSVAALPLAWLAGRRIAGREGGWVALALTAASPFAIRYATEARMYSIVQFLVLVGYLALTSALARPRALRLAGVGVTAGLLALTHYWSLYLLATVAGGLVVLAWRRPVMRRNAVLALAGMAGGGLLFLPWLPTFVYQSGHTGTPWGTPANPFDALQTMLNDFGGGPWPETRLLGLLLAVLVGLALLGRALDARRIELDLTTRPGARVEVGVVGVTFLVAMAASWASGNAFASRYTSVVFPLFLLAAALGFRVFLDPRLRAAALAVVVLLGMAGGLRNVFVERTQAEEVAEVLRANVEPGDVVAACPDQLAVAVGRLVPDDMHPRAFPDLDRSGLINWVDYEERNAADPDEFTQALLELAGPDNDVWLVWAPGYRTLANRCERISGGLAANRPGTEIVVDRDTDYFESHYLTRAPGR